MDFNQVILATLFASIGNHTNADIDENMIRHMFLVSLKYNRKKFKNEFGELIICTDSKTSWRREFYPYYKLGRRKSREESELNWEELHRIISLIRQELDEYFPYKVINIDDCEADDIIGTICHEDGTILNNGSENHLILSGDKDYIQLHKYANIKQYNPVLKKYVENSDPWKYLTEHILKGDVGDGVPNILSPDNCLVIGERQKPMTAKRIEEYSNSITDKTILDRYNRNKTLIDLYEVPDKYKKQILDAYKTKKETGRSKLFDFFIKKKLKHLLTDIQDF